MTALLSAATLLLYAIPSSIQEPQDTAKHPTLTERRVTLSLTNASLTETIESLHTLAGIDVLADVYADDMPVVAVRFDQTPLRVAVAQIGAVFEREVFVQNGTAIFRHRRWYSRAALELANEKEFGIRWRNSGSLSLHPVRQVTPSPDESAGSKVNKNKTLLDFLNSSRSVSVKANAVRMRDVASQLTISTGWTVSVDRDFLDRRVSARFRETSPGRFAEALTYLLVGSQRVHIGRDPDTARLAADMSAEERYPKSEREKQSDELLPKLLDSMTKEQREAYFRGEPVDISVSSLRPELQRAVTQYVESSGRDLNERVPGSLTPDIGRIKEFKVRASRRQTAVGVFGFSTSGTYMGY